jgi:sortase A
MVYDRDTSMSQITLRRFNNLLSLVIIALAFYIFILPFIPAVQLWIKKKTDTTNGFAYQSKLNPDVKAKPVPKDNRLVMPTILSNEPIYEGKNISVINKDGTWRRPNTSTPDKGGNSVIIAHRYTYKASAPFYNLDKIKVGDPIIVYWQGEEHDYRVTETKVVTPKAGEIEANTDEKMLTLYTCTPLWNAKDRLVVIAKPIGENQ